MVMRRPGFVDGIQAETVSPEGSRYHFLFVRSFVRPSVLFLPAWSFSCAAYQLSADQQRLTTLRGDARYTMCCDAICGWVYER